MKTELTSEVVDIIYDKKIAKYEILSCDKDRVFEIIKVFPEGLFDKKNSIDNNDIVTLTPQPWFGNINNPDIVILGRNPAFLCNAKRNDIKDNEIIKKQLKNNLKFKNRDVSINSINWILDTTQISEVQLFWWWQNKFFGQENIDIISKYSDKIGIFNLYSYYSHNSDILNDSNFQIESSLKLLDNFKDKLKNAQIVIFLWGGSISQFENKLELGNNFFKSLENTRVYIGNVNKSGHNTGINTRFFNIFAFNEKAQTSQPREGECLESWLKRILK